MSLSLWALNPLNSGSAGSLQCYYAMQLDGYYYWPQDAQRCGPKGVEKRLYIYIFIFTLVCTRVSLTCSQCANLSVHVSVCSFIITGIHDLSHSSVLSLLSFLSSTCLVLGHLGH